MRSVFAKLALVLDSVFLFELFVGNPAEPFPRRIYLKAGVVKIALKIVIPDPLDLVFLRLDSQFPGQLLAQPLDLIF